MINPNGVKANMCCASCAHLHYVQSNGFNYIRLCKKGRRIFSLGDKCCYYTMARFFQERGYKVIVKD